MSKSIKLIKSHLTQEHLHDKEVEYVNTIYCKTITHTGAFLLCEPSDTNEKHLDKSIILAIVKVKDLFKSVKVHSEDITMVALYHGDVYRFATEFDFHMLSGLFPLTRGITSGSSAILAG